ncbi:hypothetical protein ACFYKT_18445 [Cytobacillus sp. FJAT-53684]|uniref:RCK C-terminal domain-containing protein n=1 Tax=Cytobacillus mangrovibacter TaxID=3299024 RepID=A0ABW6K2A3_9BACI
MLKRSIKFPLIMKEGKQVRTLEELKDAFDIEQVIEYYYDGRLFTWLEQRYYMKEFNEIKSISGLKLNEVIHEIYDIFGIKKQDTFDVDIFLKNKEKIKSIKQYTEDLNILNNIAIVASTQQELEKILEGFNSQEENEVYLLDGEFVVDDNIGNICYIGINKPKVILDSDKDFRAETKNITFKNVTLTALRYMSLEIKDIEQVNVDLQKIRLMSLIKERVLIRAIPQLLEESQLLHLTWKKKDGELVKGGPVLGYLEDNGRPMYKDYINNDSDGRLFILNRSDIVRPNDIIAVVGKPEDRKKDIIKWVKSTTNTPSWLFRR